MDREGGAWFRVLPGSCMGLCLLASSWWALDQCGLSPGGWDPCLNHYTALKVFKGLFLPVFFLSRFLGSSTSLQLVQSLSFYVMIHLYLLLRLTKVYLSEAQGMQAYSLSSSLLPKLLFFTGVNIVIASVNSTILFSIGPDWGSLCFFFNLLQNAKEKSVGQVAQLSSR